MKTLTKDEIKSQTDPDTGIFYSVYGNGPIKMVALMGWRQRIFSGNLRSWNLVSSAGMSLRLYASITAASVSVLDLPDDGARQIWLMMHCRSFGD